MRKLRKCLTLLTLSTAVSIAASQSTPTVTNLSWTPQRVSSGGVCLFTLEVSGNPASVSADWLGHQLIFFRPPRQLHGNKLWYGLAGADVETAPASYEIRVKEVLPDDAVVTFSRTVTVVSANYRTVNLHVPEKFVEPDPDTLKRIAEERRLKDEIFAHSAGTPLWSGAFLRPVSSPPTDSFGTRRLFNGKVASIHRGMDFRAKSGTPVAATNSGTVLLARGLFFEGNCVIVDHGLGLSTIYMHLSRIDVTEGQHVEKAQRLGLSGATGRATGPHLHLAVRWEGGYLDPAGLFKLALPRQP